MEPQEAVNILQGSIDYYKNLCGEETESVMAKKLMKEKECYELAIEALKKQIPKWPEQRNFVKYCPSCDHGNPTGYYCRYCGQAFEL